ncbi:unnamed protein product, partial [Pleuronectes platessa]
SSLSSFDLLETTTCNGSDGVHNSCQGFTRESCSCCNPDYALGQIMSRQFDNLSLTLPSQEELEDEMRGPEECWDVLEDDSGIRVWGDLRRKSVIWNPCFIIIG